MLHLINHIELYRIYAIIGSMEIIKLVILIIALAVILGMLIFLYVYKPSKQKAMHKKTQESKQQQHVPSFSKLVDILKKNTSSISELQNAAELILKHYGTIKPKHGITPDKDFKRYAEVIYVISRHPNTSKELVIMFDREIRKRNPTYQREIDEMLNRGLSARG
jgi:hypothetical protein